MMEIEGNRHSSALSDFVGEPAASRVPDPPSGTSPAPFQPATPAQQAPAPEDVRGLSDLLLGPAAPFTAGEQSVADVPACPAAGLSETLDAGILQARIAGCVKLDKSPETVLMFMHVKAEAVLDRGMENAMNVLQVAEEKAQSVESAGMAEADEIREKAAVEAGNIMERAFSEASAIMSGANKAFAEAQEVPVQTAVPLLIEGEFQAPSGVPDREADPSAILDARALADAKIAVAQAEADRVLYFGNLSADAVVASSRAEADDVRSKAVDEAEDIRDSAVAQSSGMHQRAWGQADNFRREARDQSKELDSEAFEIKMNQLKESIQEAAEKDIRAAMEALPKK